MATKIQPKSTKNLYFCSWASFGDTLARFGTNLVSFWCPLGALLVVFGGLLAAFCIVFSYFLLPSIVIRCTFQKIDKAGQALACVV